MLLTGAEIADEYRRGVVSIEPFDPAQIEQNSYGFRLGHRLLDCAAAADPGFDARRPITPIASRRIPADGIVLRPNRLYLGETMEVIGSDRHACELYGNLSVAALGVWVQVSAPLGHTGAVVRWTLEIRVAQAIRLHAGMRMGKVAFWSVDGAVLPYTGRYANSRTVLQSRLVREPAG